MRYIVHGLVVGLIFSVFSVNSFAEPKLNLGLNMGLLNPDSDELVRLNYGKNFYFNGSIGIETERGFEFKGSLGHYSDNNHNPNDLYETKLGVTPLTASLIYHISPALDIDPYFGGGAGGYFYKVEDTYYGEKESGIKFGLHAIAGLKVCLNETLNVNVVYERHFIPNIYYNNAKNFDSTVLTLGVGMSLPMRPAFKEQQVQSQYKYTKEQEELLVEIQQVSSEIKEMESKRKQSQDEINSFYSSQDYDETNPDFQKKYDKIKYLEKKVNYMDDQISKAKDKLTNLKARWDNLNVDNKPVTEHIVYLKEHYIYSPYNPSFDNGYFIYNNRPYVHRYYDDHDRDDYRADDHNNNDSNKKQSDEERKKFAKEKKEYILNEKNMKLH